MGILDWYGELMANRSSKPFHYFYFSDPFSWPHESETDNVYPPSPPTARQEKKILRNKQRQQHCKNVARQQSRLASGNQASTDLKEGLFQWTVRPSPQKLYDEFITQKKKKYLTKNALKQAINFISTPSFRLFDRPSNQVMIFDEHNKNRLVGLFEFIPFSSMTREELDNLDFLAEFFHDHKSFVNPVSNFNSACLGGKMNMLGWRKCMKQDERIGLYLALVKISKEIDRFTAVVQRGHRAGLIIGKSFKQLADNAFQQNHEIMVEHKMPDFGDTKLDTSEGNNFSAASLVSYTYDGFYNTPHKDKRDASEFAFVQWIPTFSKTGKVATHADGFNVQGGEFVFPDCKFGLGFEKLGRIARMVWCATEYSHFTTPLQPNS